MAEYIPSAIESIAITALIAKVEAWETATIELQSEKVTMLDARATFDALISACRDAADHIGSEANIIQSKDFENGLVKLQSKRYQMLTPEEERMMRPFKKPEVAPNGNAAPDNQQLNNYQRLKAAAKERLLNPNREEDPYHDTHWIHPTTCIVERLFSVAKGYITPNRRSMKIDAVETLLFLRANRKLWGIQEVRDALQAARAIPRND